MNSAKKLLRVHGHPKGEQAPSLLIAPGQRFVPLPADPDGGRLLVYKLVHVGDNLFKAVAQAHERTVRITTANIRQLGLGVSAKTLYRLISAGFVKGGRISPQVCLLDLDSFYTHVDACMADPWFWDDVDRCRRYAEAKALVL